MAVTPIGAQCERCGEEFHLFELLDTRTGTCPRCNQALTPDWTQQLLEESQRADRAMRQLVASLRRLNSLPGTFTVQPASVLRNVVEETGWELLDRRTAAAQPERTVVRRVVDFLLGRKPAPALGDLALLAPDA